MADTAHVSDADKLERYDPPDVLERKLDQLAQWVRESRHGMFFTGAGISTACGVPDFRSGMNTKLATGPGAWELRANKKGRPRGAKTTSTLKAVPSATHMLMRELLTSGQMRFLVSQNTDGLHRRSGVPLEQMAELHGNTNLERCVACGKEYLRDFKCRRAGNRVHDHVTARTCSVPGCGGALHDSIVNFGENLPERDIDLAFAHAAEADLCIAMGSSLRVTPAADVPEQVAERGRRLVVVNLQRTPLDSGAALVIHAMCDDVSRGLARRLGVDIPAFKLSRYVRLGTADRRGHLVALARGEDAVGTPFSFLAKAAVSFSPASVASGAAEWVDMAERPRRSVRVPSSLPDGAAVRFRFEFAGHYNEPPLELTHTLDRVNGGDDRAVRHVEYDPATGQWASSPLAPSAPES